MASSKKTAVAARFADVRLNGKTHRVDTSKSGTVPDSETAEAEAAVKKAAEAALTAAKPRDRLGRFRKRSVIARLTGRP
jgi:hypothetical protein